MADGAHHERKKLPQWECDPFAFHKATLESVTLPLFCTDTGGSFVNCNSAFECFFGVTSAAIRGKLAGDIFPAAVTVLHHQACLQLLQRPDSRAYETRVRDAKGAQRDVTFNLSTIVGAEGEILGIVGVIFDIGFAKEREISLLKAKAELETRVAERTKFIASANLQLFTLNQELLRVISEREQLENELERSCARLSTLVGELNIAEEKERRRIATELHDHVVQNLALGQMKLNMLNPREGTSLSAEFMASLNGTFEGTIRHIRDICFDLSSPLLYEIGLVEAIESLGERFARDHHFAFSCKGDLGRLVLGNDMRVLLYQTARELLINAVKHARARSITVGIRHRAGVIRMSVTDDGIGFPKQVKKRFGLSNISQRIGYLQGEMKITSSRSRMTVVEVVVPVPAKR